MLRGRFLACVCSDFLPDNVHIAPFRLGIENQLIAVEAEMPNLLRADKVGEPTSLNVMHNRLVDYVNREGPEVPEVIAPRTGFVLGRCLTPVFAGESRRARTHELCRHVPISGIRELTDRIWAKRIAHTAGRIAFFP